jgi:hypothetical protein
VGDSMPAPAPADSAVDDDVKDDLPLVRMPLVTPNAAE